MFLLLIVFSALEGTCKDFDMYAETGYRSADLLISLLFYSSNSCSDCICSTHTCLDECLINGDITLLSCLQNQVELLTKYKCLRKVYSRMCVFFKINENLTF